MKKQNWWWIGLIVVIILVLFFINNREPTQEERVRKLIRDRYEVLDIGERRYYEEEYPPVYVDMVTFGQREDQVFEGLSALSIVYKNASRYEVTIFEETQKCIYYIDRELWESWLKGELDTLIEEEIEKAEICY